MAKGQLIVRNVEQAAAWLELDGQISDGMWWENVRDDSWKDWCAAEVVVARPGELRGRTFFTRKDNYNVSSPQLLDVVGKRMLGIVRIARHVGLAAAAALEHAVSCDDGRIDWAPDYRHDNITQLSHLGVTPAQVDAALADESYTLAHLRVDLQDLKVIMRTKLDVARG